MKILNVSMLLLFWLAASTPVIAEVSSRECIRFTENSQSGSPQQVRVPGSSTHSLATVEFEIKSPSDAIVDVALFFQDSATLPRSRARYTMTLDGSSAQRLGQPIQYYVRTPANTDGTNHLRFFFQDIPSGIHELELTIVNTSTTSIDLSGLWVTPLFVDSTESGLADQRFLNQTVGSDWQTLAEVTIPGASRVSRALYLYSYVRAAAPGEVEFRYLSRGIVLDDYKMNFHNSDDGGVFKFFFKNPTAGEKIFFQARGSATVSQTEFFAQSLKKYSVIEAKRTSSITVPNNNQLEMIHGSPEVTLNSLSLGGLPASNPGQFKTCGWGGATTLMSMADSTEAAIHMTLFKDGSSTPLFNDIGVNGHSPDPVRDIYRDQSDWGCNVGLFQNSTYRVELSVQGLCPGGAPITVDQSRFQILVLPSPDPGNYACIKGGSNPTCPYDCTLNPNLVRVAKPPRNRCNN